MKNVLQSSFFFICNAQYILWTKVVKKSCINLECCISKHAYEFITIYLFFNEFQGMRTLKKNYGHLIGKERACIGKISMNFILVLLLAQFNDPPSPKILWKNLKHLFKEGNGLYFHIVVICSEYCSFICSSYDMSFL